MTVLVHVGVDTDGDFVNVDRRLMRFHLSNESGVLMTGLLDGDIRSAATVVDF